MTTGLDHISFRASGLDEMRRHLQAQGVQVAEAPIPGWNIHQLFLHDPHGLKIEMTFWLADEKSQP